MENQFLPLPSNCAPCKISEQTKPRSLAFFRMKLHAAYVLLGHDRGVCHSVISFADHHSFIGGLAVKRMNEIEEPLIRNSFQQRMRTSLTNLVPTNVRDNLI